MATQDEIRVTELYRTPNGNIHEVPYGEPVEADWRKVGENVDGRPRVNGYMHPGPIERITPPPDPAPAPEPSVVQPRTGLPGLVEVPTARSQIEIDPLLMDVATHLRAAIALIESSPTGTRQLSIVRTKAQEALLEALFGHLV